MPEQFLDDRELGEAIIGLMAGCDVRCAVAFWGTGAVDRLFVSGFPTDARIVCDISLGATNPRELSAMGAPRNRRVKHLENLHAKVYLSSLGGIVCSANASDNGIGFVNAAGLIEAGVLLGPGSDAYRRTEAWFEDIWKSSSNLNRAALERTEEAWNRRSRRGAARIATSIPDHVPSLLRTVASDPHRFRGIGFVFTNGQATVEDRDEAREELIRLDDQREIASLASIDRKRLSAWNIGDVFTGWSEQDLDAWPRRFVCIYRPRKRASYWFYQRKHEVLMDEDNGVVFAERPSGLRADLGFEHGSDAMLANDTPLLARLFNSCEERGHWLCENGESLARLIQEVEGT